MRKLPSSTTVGLFILGSVMVFVVAILLFSSGFHWSRRHSFVLDFSESINGLDVGAPVKMLGVQVGQVRSVSLRFDPAKKKISVPVTITLDDTYFTISKGDHGTQSLSWPEGSHPESQMLCGLVGSLQTDSFVTGKLFVELSYEPLGAQYPVSVGGGKIREIPTRASNLQNLSGQVMTIVEGLSSIDYASIGTSVQEIFTQLSQIPFASTGKNLGQIFQEFAESARHLRLLLGDGSSMRIDLDRCLRNMGSAAAVIQLFFEYLERNPDALLRGKYVGDHL
ncbi:MAG: MlaD family protein [Puniceicoccales bacterium]|jgi:paraquat-inducible protein B|nr:MlaD family protein [Puniceicoccales bacterium]